MTNMHDLARLMKDLEDQLVVCMRCGMCQSVCPLFARTGLEADVARGKLALLDGLMRQMFTDPQGVYERLDRCLLCGSCAANCPSGVDVMEIFLKARVILVGCMGLSPAKRAVLRGMLARPERFDRLVGWGARLQKVFTRPANPVIGTSCARWASPLLSERHLTPLADAPFHQAVRSLNTGPGASGLKAAFFVGCLIDKIFPRVARCAVHALNHHGVGIFMPEGQACCGIPAISSGDMKTFRQLAAHNIALFESESFDVLITACATCTATIKKIWPTMLDRTSGNLREKAARIAAKTMDINQFLVSEVGVRPAVENDRAHTRTVTYHDPCHLKKTLGVDAEPRTLIRANPAYRLKEMVDADACCGMGGSFNLQHYDMSTQIGMYKRDRIHDTGSSVVATGCPACMIQMADMLSRSKDRVAVRHPIEIYAETLGGFTSGG